VNKTIAFKVKQRVKFWRFVPESARGGGGYHWCNGRGAVGASGLVSARTLVTQMRSAGWAVLSLGGFFEVATLGTR
jgi:hypothetical protein